MSEYIFYTPNDEEAICLNNYVKTRLIYVNDIACKDYDEKRAFAIKIVDALNQKPPPPPQNSEALEALDKAMTIIVKEASACVTSQDLPSDVQEDYKRKVPVWILKEFTELHEKQRQRGIRLKAAFERLKTIRAALTAQPESVDLNVELIKMRQDWTDCGCPPSVPCCHIERNENVFDMIEDFQSILKHYKGKVIG